MAIKELFGQKRLVAIYTKNNIRKEVKKWQSTLSKKQAK